MNFQHTNVISKVKYLDSAVRCNKRTHTIYDVYLQAMSGQLYQILGISVASQYFDSLLKLNSLAKYISRVDLTVLFKLDCIKILRLNETLSILFALNSVSWVKQVLGSRNK